MDIQTPEPLEQLLNLDELAEYLGVKKGAIYKWRVEGKGPRAIKVGKHLRFRRSDIKAWLDDQRDDTEQDGPAE